MGCDRRSNTAKRARPLQTGLRPEPHAERYAGTPRAPLRVADAATPALRRVVSCRGVRLARRDEGACRWHVTEEATPPGGHLGRKPRRR